MKTPILLTAALLLGSTAVGTALAATDPAISPTDTRVCSDPGEGAAAAPGERFRVADRDRGREHRKHERRHHRHHDDDDDDDDDRGRGHHGRDRGEKRERLPATGPADPAAPVPDNGLFQGKTRPKVEVN